jgi:hypothetical protein
MQKHELSLVKSIPTTPKSEVNNTNVFTKEQITVNQKEFDRAADAMVWLFYLDGGMRLEGLSQITGVGICELKAWALRERLLWVDNEGYYFLYLSALPLIWSAFADKSRACLAHHEVTRYYGDRAEEGSLIREWLDECASTPRWATKDKLAPRLRSV